MTKPEFIVSLFIVRVNLRLRLGYLVVDFIYFFSIYLLTIYCVPDCVGCRMTVLQKLTTLWGRKEAQKQKQGFIISPLTEPVGWGREDLNTEAKYI